MVYIHVSPETLRRYPWIGVGIGLVGVLMMGFIATSFWGEWQRLGPQGSPEELMIDAAFDAPASRRWVRLSGGDWDCASACATERRAPEAWIFGRIDDTQVTVLGTAGRVVILKFDGAIDCAALAGRPVTGMLVTVGDSVWGGGVARPLRERGTERRVLCVGAGPEKARNDLLLASAFLVGFVGFTGYYTRIWLRRRQTASRPRFGAPIEPS